MTPTASGNGLTWVQAGTVLYNDIASPGKRLTLFRAMGASPTSGAVTIDFSGNSQSGIAWSIFEFDGVDTSGSDGENAVAQVVSEAQDSQASPYTLTLAAFGSVDNIAVGCLAKDGSEVIDPLDSFVEIHELANGSPGSNDTQTQWKDADDPTIQWGGSWTRNLGAIGLEVVAATGGQDLVRVEDEDEQVSEALVRRVDLVRTDGDTEQVTEATGRNVTLVRVVGRPPP